MNLHLETMGNSSQPYLHLEQLGVYVVPNSSGMHNQLNQNLLEVGPTQSQF